MIKSKNFEYRTDKLKSDEEYRIVLFLGRDLAELVMEMV